MNTKIIKVPTGGKIKAIPSKSAAHRLLICACLSGLEIGGVCEELSEDIGATADCLLALRASIEANRQSPPILNCRESGSTLRFLLPVSAALHGEAYLTGSGRLMQRPLKELEDQLRSHGCHITGKENSIHISGMIRGGSFVLPGNVSSQYISGLLFALPLLEEDSLIRIKGELQSKPYVDMTLDALRRSGIKIEVGDDDAEYIYEIEGRQRYALSSFAVEDIEGDWSNSAFWLVAEELGADIDCTGLKTDSLQGDKRILEIIEDSRKSGVLTIDVKQTPDLVPAIALIAMGRRSADVTRIINAGRLRMKESDRIESVVAASNALGGNAKATENEICITATGDRRLKPRSPIDSFNDHRIVMMAAIGAMLCDDSVEIRDSQAVNKSYPGFFDDYVSLGGEIEIIE